MLPQTARRLQERLQILNCLAATDGPEAGSDIRAGMMQPQKSIPSKYFYDARGSRLFEQICGLPEYYLTRTELAILKQSAPEIMTFFARDCGDLVELGSGSNHKINLLLAAAGGSLGNLRYVPIDISSSALHEASLELLAGYEDLHILGIIADFTRHLDCLPPTRKLITFLGSTIGNFSRIARISFLRQVAHLMRPRDRFVVGLDMLKPPDLIEAAYNDRYGVTAEFNKNILHHLNRRFNANFNVDDFEHEAVFREDRERVEMHLRAKRRTSAWIKALQVSAVWEPGEAIRTEICQKFSRAGAERDFQEAGLAATRWLTDPQSWFSLVILKKRAN